MPQVRKFEIYFYFLLQKMTFYKFNIFTLLQNETVIGSLEQMRQTSSKKKKIFLEKGKAHTGVLNLLKLSSRFNYLDNILNYRISHLIASDTNG